MVQPDTGDVVASRNPSGERPIASTTKMMTALLSIEHARPSDVFRVASYNLSPGVDRRAARQREDARGRPARALMLPSANEAAVTLAIGVAGSQARFVKMMNQRARQLGLRHTHFGNPIGLDVGANHSSARDLAKLAQVLRANAFLRATMNMRRATLHSGPVGRVVVNRNSLVQEIGWVDGVKTGHTTLAGFVLVASGTRNGVPVISAVLGEPDEGLRNSDSLALLRYAAARYHEVLVTRKGRRMARVPLAYRDTTVALVASARPPRDPAGEKTTITLVGVPKKLDGPLPRGSRQGTIVVRYRGRGRPRGPADSRAGGRRHRHREGRRHRARRSRRSGSSRAARGGYPPLLGDRRRRRRREARRSRPRPSRQETGVA